MLTLQRKISTENIYAVIYNKKVQYVKILTEKGIKIYYNYSVEVDDSEFICGKTDDFICYVNMEFLHKIDYINHLDNDMTLITLKTDGWHKDSIWVSSDESRGKYVGLGNDYDLDYDIIISNYEWSQFINCLKEALPDESKEILLKWRLKGAENSEDNN